ncbi:hypothetical protein, partial [Paracoccus sp. (in: a-proteobacteria)]|uniref:hypothetical protein n=1 Tax=Paracoccus sp. TaxID=267 RepID=UPI002B002B51
LLEAAPAVHTSYFYNQCVQDHIAAYTGYTCVVFSRVSQGITYEPPFIYSYQCSSVFATNYATIYVYTFILVGFVMPALKSLAVMVRDRCNIDSAVYNMINSAVPVNLRPLTVIVPTPVPEYFERQRFIVKANNYLAILSDIWCDAPATGCCDLHFYPSIHLL